MSRVFLTGGAGFIGSHTTTALLDRGDEVVVLDDFNDFYDPRIKRTNVEGFLDRPGYRLVEGDIRDRDLVRSLYREGDFDSTIHLAARAGVRPSLREPVLYEEVNCVATLHLLEAARDFEVPNFVFGSSSSVYGINDKVPFSEDDEINQPISPYATTKRTGELFCFNYHHLYGLRTSCLRFFTVYGPSQRPEMAIHAFTRKLASGESITMFGDGSSRRDYTFIDDIVSGILAAHDLAPGFEIFNLGGAETTRLDELVSWIAEELGVEVRADRQSDQQGDVPITYADVSKAERLLGYNPQVPIREGLRRFVSWYRAHSQPAL